MPIKEDMQVTNSNHAVPQNIMDVEFKLIGDLTMRQFFYILVFGGGCWLSIAFLDGIFKWPLAVTSGLLGIGLAFIPLEDRGLDQWIINFFKSVYSPTQRVWKKDPIVPSVFTYQNLAMVRQELITLAPTSSRRKLEEYLEFHEIERPHDSLDFQDQKYITMVKDAFVTVETAPPEVYAQPVSVPEDQTYMPSGPEMQPPTAPQEPTTLVQEVYPELKPSPEVEKNIQQGLGGQPVQAETVQTQPLPASPPVQPVPQQTTVPAPTTPVPPIRKPVSIQAPAQKQQQPKQRVTQFTESMMTPDRRSGRVFTNLLPKEGDIILPIRGERMLKTSEEVSIEVSIEEKSSQLQKLIEQIKGDEQYKEVFKGTAAETAKPAAPTTAVDETGQPTPPQTPPTLDVQAQQAKEILERVKAENVRLSQELEKLKTQPQARDQVQKLEQARSLTSAEYIALQNKIKELEDQLKVKQQVSGGPRMAINTTTHASLPPTPTEPNILSGVVKNQFGLGLEGVVVLIKNSKDEPKRALKTNSLGQFASNTPVLNGSYKIEVDGINKTGLAFDIISIEANGGILNPLAIIGREKA